MSIRGVSHFYFETKAYGKTREFWESLGFKQTLDLSRVGEGAGLFQSEEKVLMIKEVQGTPESEIYFGVKDAEETARVLQKHPVVKITKGVYSSHWDTKLIEIQDPDGRKFFLEQGNGKKDEGERAKTIVNLAVFCEGRICLVKYAGMPDHQKGWFVPHAKLGRAEDPVEACRRIANQLGIPNSEKLQPLARNVQSFVGQDGTWHLSFDYALDIRELPRAAVSPEFAACEWFAVNQMPAKSEMAHHGWAQAIVKGVVQ